jgi:hypothetical protein
METFDYGVAKRCCRLVRLLYRLRVWVASRVGVSVGFRHCKTIEGLDG